MTTEHKSTTSETTRQGNTVADWQPIDTAPRNDSTGKSINPAVESGVFTVVYPFVRCRVDVFDYSDEESGALFTEIDSWRPGTRNEMRGHGEYHYTVTEADGLGQMVLTVVSVHKPGRYPTRVFYTRKFITPDGKTFGKGTLHVCSLGKFRRISNAFQHEYELSANQPLAYQPPPPATEGQ